MGQGIERVLRHGNRTDIETRQAVYSVVYGLHTSPLNPQLLVPKPDIVLLESGNANWSADPAHYVTHLKNSFPPYSQLISTCEERAIQVAFGDFGLTSKALGADFVFFGASKALTANTLAVDLVSKALQRERICRRELVGKTLAAAFLGMPLVTSCLNTAAVFTDTGQNITAEIKQLADTLNPEDHFIINTLRNKVIAYKEQQMARDLWDIYGRKPHIATVIGAQHLGLERELTISPQRQAAFLKRWKTLVSNVPNNPKTFTSGVILSFSGNQWIIKKNFEFPVLKTLIV